MTWKVLMQREATSCNRSRLLYSALLILICICGVGRAQGTAAHSYFIDCSSGSAGDGSQAHPWNTLEAAQAHVFAPGDEIALARGTTCRGSFAPQGSGAEGKPIRLTAYGDGPRPRIVAPVDARQILQLFNQEYWQIDSLDLSGANTYGIFVSGDRGPLHHIYLKNLYVHDVRGGELKHKDNGLVLLARGSETSFMDDVLIDGVDTAHTNQWAGIMVGGGNYGNGTDPILNRHVVVRNSTAHDVYGDGIVLFRSQDSVIRTSAAWETGMQPTESTGTPNAIWTWTCTDCTVEDNEAYVTDSPGVDGGAYDIDWHNTRNTVQRNYGHDTEGYCVAVFAAGFTTSESVVRDNVCVNNGVSPRLAALQGAVYLHTWNDGPIKGLVLEGNRIEWNPPVPDAAAIVNDALVKGDPIGFRRNHVVSNAVRIYRSSAQLAASDNTYAVDGEPLFTFDEMRDVNLGALLAAGKEAGSRAVKPPRPEGVEGPLRIDAALALNLDADGLIVPDARAQLVVLRDLAGQYGQKRLTVHVHLRGSNVSTGEKNALRDLEDVYPGAMQFDRDAAGNESTGTIRLKMVSGAMLQEWHGFQNAAVLGTAVRDRIGPPRYAHAQKPEFREETK
jgi:hypothetical protein